MFDGKTFLPVTGMPIRKMACMSSPFALAEPVPFTVPILNAKSLMRELEGAAPLMFCSAIAYRRCGVPRSPDLRPCPSRVRNQQLELRHVPRSRRTPLRTQSTVQADVFVLHHDALRL